MKARGAGMGGGFDAFTMNQRLICDVLGAGSRILRNSLDFRNLSSIKLWLQGIVMPSYSMVVQY